MREISLRKYFLILLVASTLAISLMVSANLKTPLRRDPVEKLAAVECRTIQHTVGRLCVPEEPKRLVTLSIVTLANAIAVNIKPIGSNNFYQSTESIAYLNKEDKDFEVLGRSQPNLEKLLLIKPDLIIGWSSTGKDIYPLLSRIAPTALDDFQGAPSWRDHFNFVARTLGKEKVAEEAWNSYYKKASELKSALEKHYQNKTVSFIHIGTRGIESDVNNSFAGSILKDVGLQRSKAQDVSAPYGIISISEEELYKADGDILFVTAWTKRYKQVLTRLQQKPLWKHLKAVQNNQVYFVDFATWTGSNLLAANAVLDDLEKYLVNTPVGGRG
jgi:iron complex transport system substrate-binding protein